MAALRPRRFRVTRPTDRLAALERFYVEGVGLEVRGRFAGHAGYDGLILAWGEDGAEIEFTQHEDGSPGPVPTAENLLVFYLDDAAAVEEARARLAAHGAEPAPPENPYWEGIGLAFLDPDGWPVMLVDQAALDARR
jgi:catechol 2,3-dioxygenase-like lactoylglutathione lyase family enzyme